MIETAVILAAGMGSRIRERTGYNPKGFLQLDEIPLIEHSISKMLTAGIKKIFIGTGFMKEAYEKLAYKYEQIQCVYNPDFETTGSMYTLYRLKDVINEDFLLVESDLIYERSALSILMNHGYKDVILSSKLTDSGDEVLIEIDEKHHLVNMSKAKADLMNISGELVGITKLSYSTFQKICSHIELLPNFHKMDYENGIVAIADQIPFYVHQENDLVWCEVDDEGHWTRAVQFIYPLIKARENVLKSINRTILLNPGPATTTDTVKYAQVVEDICPREEEFGRVMEFISNELTEFVGNLEEYTTVLFGGSGTAAVESILSSVIDDQAILIINNGAYGKRMCKIADVYGLEFFEYASPVDEAIDLSSLEQFINNVPTKLSHLAVVHCETSTGLLNNLEAVGELCQKYKLSMIVDAMSSFAAIPIDMNKMNISYLAASSNKNLQGMAGVSFVIADKAQLEKTKQYKQRNVYLNLFTQYHYFKLTNQMQFTPPVQTLYALKQAILETKWEGIQSRYKRYTKSWETLIEGVSRLGLKHLVDKNSHSRIITSIIEPSQPTYDFNEMHDYFYRNGFTIYPGKVNTLQTFRIANIGDISYLDIERFIRLLERYLEWLREGNKHETI
ncbi:MULTISPECIES: 2-aminoethylphosphonate aminotransferase [Metabacillus]|uniref:2-aminoethylphosphonate--pyruvate transaminase n=2 Tax=Metabacillus TaxID=2675233 RepID=A0A179T754_9BACI|nr:MULTISPECIES: 2-aminoethylphosphonate--pyruvate transaminase [Metabacillus]OAS89404.1 nucleotidyl transferase [Metabacillus litoralis]QNF28921.1 2-aminoethylphosphonate--pyruvate transaminase [Metabacillus sp. KUDC1714]